MPIRKIYNLTDHWFPDKIGGSCIYGYKLHQLLSPRVTTETLTLIGEPAACEQQMVVHKVLDKARIWRNRKVLRQFGCDADTVWIVHSPWFFLHLFFAFGFKVRKRTVAVYHGPWYREYYVSAAAQKNRLVKLAVTLIRYLVELLYCLIVRRFIFLSETMYRATSEFLPIARSKVHIVPMWSAKESWDRPRQKHDRPILSTFRRLEPRMGLQDFIQALHRCDLQEYRLVICGDGPYKDELAKLIQELNLQHRVELAGWVTQEEKFRLIKESDAVVIPSRTLEGFSLLALEALECGTPVLITEQVGFYEYVRDIDQDFVKAIDLQDAKIEIRPFLAKGQARKGLDRLEAIFSAEQIRQDLLHIVKPDERSASEPSAVSSPTRRRAPIHVGVRSARV